MFETLPSMVLYAEVEIVVKLDPAAVAAVDVAILRRPIFARSLAHVAYANVSFVRARLLSGS